MPSLARKWYAAGLIAALWVGREPVRANEAPANSFARALQLRAGLDATPRLRRTPGQYGQVLNAFRAVYHADRAAPDADASAEAVAELLAEEGRVFGDQSLLHSAVEQLEFIQRDFGASRFAAPALLTEGEIEARDLHDPGAARERFTLFLRNYPRSPLAGQAELELRRLNTRSAPMRTPENPDYEVLGDTPAPQAPARYTSPPARESGVAPAQIAAVPEQTAPAATEPRPPATPSQLREQDVPYPAPAPGALANTSPDNAGAMRPTRLLGNVPVYRRDPANKLATVTGMRHWSTSSYTRVAIDVGDEVPFEASRVSRPDRIFFDLHGARLATELAGQAVTVTDGGFLQRIRAAQFSGDVVRVVLDVSDVSDYSAFWLPNPSRLIVDIHGENSRGGPKQATAPALASAPPGPNGTAAARAAAEGSPTPRAARAAAPGTFVAETTLPGAATPATPPLARSSDSVAAIAALSQQPSRVRATAAPTTAPVAGGSPDGPVPTPPRAKTRRAKAPDSAGVAPTETARAAEPDSTGGRSMVRALGLKINRIVVDAGHGGHDSGTLGPGGIEEKDVVLDVALRLGKLLKQRLGADVIYTRDDDTFIPLETRTAIANKAQADLFISVHANSSPDPGARGVETYYLNFTTSADALEVAARENAVSDESIHQLSDLVKKITLQDKIAESREFANDVEASLYGGLEAGNAGLKDRGVKKAPFVVLIGANMPSILAEISFLTNPSDAAELREGAYRQRIAESLYEGVARYMRSLSGTRLEESASAH